MNVLTKKWQRLWEMLSPLTNKPTKQFIPSFSAAMGNGKPFQQWAGSEGRSGGSFAHVMLNLELREIWILSI
ncbi:MAG: hypothetical protein JW384_02148 [Nitrosomonadaceae bacterium]|nr:hypothetical protein [Nitrosomonadaceae bacterium]